MRQTAFLRASRANARAADAQSENGQRGRVGIANLPIHTKFCPNPINFTPPYCIKTRTEAISLRACRAGSAKSLSVGPSGPKNNRYRMAEVPLNPNNNKPLSISLSFHLKDVVEINEPQVGWF